MSLFSFSPGIPLIHTQTVTPSVPLQGGGHSTLPLRVARTLPRVGFPGRNTCPWSWTCPPCLTVPSKALLTLLESRSPQVHPYALLAKQFIMASWRSLTALASFPVPLQPRGNVLCLPHHWTLSRRCRGRTNCRDSPHRTPLRMVTS